MCKRLRVLFCLALLMCVHTRVFAHAYTLGNLHIEHPWARATAALAKTGVVYFSLKNNAAPDDTLLGISVGKSIAQGASMHEMAMDAKGMMHMRALTAGLKIPAGAEIKFTSGGKHVMLEGLVKPLVAKQEFALTLRFAKAGAIAVIVRVE
jgi:periplasmic copper chaperone A